VKGFKPCSDASLIAAFLAAFMLPAGVATTVSLYLTDAVAKKGHGGGRGGHHAKRGGRGGHHARGHRGGGGHHARGHHANRGHHARGHHVRYGNYSHHRAYARGHYSYRSYAYRHYSRHYYRNHRGYWYYGHRRHNYYYDRHEIRRSVSHWNGRWWGGRWYAYGVGPCWSLQRGGLFIWVCVP
jgi:hypothetical protein